MTIVVICPQEVNAMHTRICQVRKNEGLSQTEFADKLSLTKNYISLIENGNRVPSDRTISDICEKFNVNKDWLLTGEGEMRRPVSRNTEIAAFMGEVMRGESEDFRRRLVAALAKLDSAEWEMLERLALNLAEEAKKEGQT